MRVRVRSRWPLLLGSLLAGACAAPAPRGVEARQHLHVLGGTIGSRPAGTAANRRARAYLIDQLERSGFEVRTQEADSVRPGRGQTTRVVNIIATRSGVMRDAIGLLSHYDSSPFAPGAADDALGVAASLEAARALAARGGWRHTLMVLITDGEEAGLMGAEALVKDPDVAGRLRAYLNLEALGPDGPAVLFESADGALVDVWQDSAPWPRGTSYAAEIYKRLPNDTDFTVFSQAGIRGLNFATIGSSAVYHTSRDTPDRVPDRTLRQTVDNAIAIVETLDRRDLSQPAAGDRVFFDILNRIAFSYGMLTARVLAIAGILFALTAWLKSGREVRRRFGTRAVVLAGFWSLVGAAAIVAMLLGITATLRALHGSNHPWYAYPERLLALFALAGAAGVWLLIRAGGRLPGTLRGALDPRIVWVVALPVWMMLGVGVEIAAPAASYLWTLPLLTAGLLLSAAPRRSPGAFRLASSAILLFVALFWIRDTIVLHGFVVEQMARLPIRAPAFAYVLLPALAGVMILPPLVAMFGGESAGPSFKKRSGRLLAIGVALAAVLTVAAPSYTFDRPLRRTVRYIHDGASGAAFWEVGSLEPHLEIEPVAGAPRGWERVDAPYLADLSVTGLRMPFLYRTATDARHAPPPVDVRATRDGGTLDLAITMKAPADAEVFFSMPGGVPLRNPSLPGRIRRGRWVASYGAPPAGVVTLRFGLALADLDRLADAAVIVDLARLTAGPGWQGLPPWLPQERAVWTAREVVIEPLSAAIRGAASGLRAGAAPPPLR